jgi:hypothetical protein
MKIIAALKREELKLEKQVGKLQRQLDGVRAATKALGHSAGKEISREVTQVKRRSAAARRRMSLAAKARWKKLKAIK